MTEDPDYHERVLRLLEDSYVAADERGDICGGSGSSGDLAYWAKRRRIIARAFDHDGAWLDVGCANGLLMHTLRQWTAEQGLTIEPFGLELSARIAERARLRFPQWADRIWTGNIMTFAPPIRFDYVTALTDFVPPERCPAMLERIASLYLKPGGRVILSSYGPGGFLVRHRAGADDPRRHFEAIGLAVTGNTQLDDPESGLVKIRTTWGNV
ncbi:MAG TPA: class I SAM-dependent methyltransferase [Candidatus Binataceae bacterium]|nr:class I SAM-dependent methyltransferase [Candidatus Binataceae bacterium]